MSQAALDGLSKAQTQLDLALDGNDTRAIENACETFRAAVFDVRATGAWRDRPELARRAADILGRVEIAQQRVKNMTRETRERLSAIDAARPNPALTLYNKGGHTAR